MHKSVDKHSRKCNLIWTATLDILGNFFISPPVNRSDLRNARLAPIYLKISDEVSSAAIRIIIQKVLYNTAVTWVHKQWNYNSIVLSHQNMALTMFFRKLLWAPSWPQGISGIRAILVSGRWVVLGSMVLFILHISMAWQRTHHLHCKHTGDTAVFHSTMHWIISLVLHAGSIRQT